MSDIAKLNVPICGREGDTMNPIEIPFIKEPSAKFYTCLPGMACLESYDYINQYLYINLRNSDRLLLTNQIIIDIETTPGKNIREQTKGQSV